MDFRRSIPADATGIAALEEEIFSDAWSYRDIQDLICTEGGMCFSAIEGDEVIAYVIGRLIAPEGEIYRIAVRPDKRGRGGSCSNREWTFYTRGRVCQAQRLAVLRECG